MYKDNTKKDNYEHRYKNTKNTSKQNLRRLIVLTCIPSNLFLLQEEKILTLNKM